MRMRLNVLSRLMIVAAVVFALALLGAGLAARQQARRHVAPHTTAAALAQRPDADVAATQLVGFAINFHHAQDITAHLQAIDQIADMGFNALEVLTPAFQEDGAATDIQVTVGPGLSPTRQDLVTLLVHAKQRGLKTILMPLVLFTHPRGNEWRGKISPHDWDAWWASYHGVIDHFISVADEANVDVFMIGSELISTERQTDRWTELIAHLRTVFAGRLAYSTNWDHYHWPLFWDRLDMIGINGYWQIADSDNGVDVDPGALAKRWQKIREQVLAFADAQDRPVLFTEIGYPSLPWALKDPWNYVAGGDTPAAPDVQAMGYQAFLAAWGDAIIPPGAAAIEEANQPAEPAAADDARRMLRGVFFYSWDPYQSGGPTDTGYGVRGKPAMDVLRRWLTTDK